MYKLSYYNFLIQDPNGQFFLLYNSLYNGLYEIGKEQFETLQQFEKKGTISTEDMSKLSASFKTLLYKTHIVIDSNYDELSIVQRREKIIRQNLNSNKSVFLTIVPTNSCNLDCVYCFEGEKRHKGIICRFRRYPPSHFGDTRSLFSCMTIQTG